MTSLSGMDGIYVEWSTNEKVALEIAIGAAYGGVRAMSSMKHVGLNVAADPFFAAATTGVAGGLVIVSCDDPGLHSSQGEQDNRHYAKFAQVPMLEPTDSEDAYQLMGWAYEISEKFDTPVLFRSTTRISHCKGIVNVNKERPARLMPPGFKHDKTKYVMVPAYARERRKVMAERLKKLTGYVEEFPLNQIYLGSRRLGVISSGIAYQYAREVFEGASFLKLVTTYPIPEQLVRRFAQQVERLIVIEELTSFLEEQVRMLGIEVSGKEFIPANGELNADIVERGAMSIGLPKNKAASKLETKIPPLPARPPLLCAGCPHRATEYVLRRLGFQKYDPAKGYSTGGVIVTGDIGCYTLGVLPPLSALDTCTCMGASIGQALGLEKAGVSEKVIAIIGDSTFMHSGITGLVDVVYNQGKTTVVILDNGTTAMTGHQGHPGTGMSARREKVGRVELETLCKGIGVPDVNTLDAFNLAALKSTIKRCVESDEPAVVIARGDCPLNVRRTGRPLAVDRQKCSRCHLCLGLGCPAISLSNGEIAIESLCIGAGCSICAQLCPVDAIHSQTE